MKRVGIVILNYETYEETMACVDSINRHNLEYEKLVIVDNASSNEAYSVLKKHYMGDNKVHVLQTKSNLGFAKGNNRGILYLRKMGIDTILLLNSDTVILKDDFITEMLRACTDHVGVVGVEIRLKQGMRQSGEYEDFSLCFSIYSFLRFLCKRYYIYFPLVYKKISVKKLRVHGCSILLTSDFFKKYECLWPYTFLYREEMILSIMAEKAGLKTEIADTWIYHKESVTTNRFWTRYSRKREQLETRSYLQQIIVKVLPYCIIKSIIRSWVNAEKF